MSTASRARDATRRGGTPHPTLNRNAILVQRLDAKRHAIIAQCPRLPRGWKGSAIGGCAPFTIELTNPAGVSDTMDGITTKAQARDGWQALAKRMLVALEPATM